MTTKTDKVRALTLAALVVFSVFAAGVAFTGSAAAAEEINEGEWYYQGQQLNFTDSTYDNTSLQLVTAEDGDPVRPLETDENGTVLFGSSSLNGQYTVQLANGTKLANFSVLEQTLDVSFDPADTDTDAGSSLVFSEDDNRAAGDYDVILTSEELTKSQLNDWFTDAYENSDGDIQVDGEDINNDEIAFNPEGTGTFNVTVEAADTTASNTAEITVSEPGDETVSLTNAVVSEEQGDVASVTIELSNTDTATIQFGSSGVNYVANATVVDEDGDGEVTVNLNTYTTGNWSGDGTGISVAGDDSLGNTSNVTTVSSPIETGDYDILVGSGDSLNFQGDDDEDDIGTLVLNDRSTDGASTWVAPAGEAPDNRAALLDVVSDDDSVAIDSNFGELFVVQVQASGVYGYIDGDSNLSSDSANASEHGAYLTLSEDDAGPNAPESSLDVGNASEIITDAENNTFYVVFDSTADLGTDFEDGDSYTATFTLNETNEYIANSDSEESVETGVSFVDRAAAFNNLNSDDTLEVEQGEEVTVSGTSSLATGSDVTVRLRASGNNPFLKTQSVTVENGEWEATFDTSDTEIDSEFNAALRNDGDEIQTAGGIIVESISDETPEPTTTATPTATPTPTSTPTTAPPTETMAPTDTATEEPEPTTTADGGQPGFGVVVALLAMLGAALLAARRFE